MLTDYCGFVLFGIFEENKNISDIIQGVLPVLNKLSVNTLLK